MKIKTAWSFPLEISAKMQRFPDHSGIYYLSCARWFIPCKMRFMALLSESALLQSCDRDDFHLFQPLLWFSCSSILRESPMAHSFISLRVLHGLWYLRSVVPIPKMHDPLNNWERERFTSSPETSYTSWPTLNRGVQITLSQVGRAKSNHFTILKCEEWQCQALWMSQRRLTGKEKP